MGCQHNSKCLVPCAFLSLGFTRSLSITTPEQMIEKAKGETAYLPCKFTLSPEDQGPLDIEWLISPADNQKVDQVVSLICPCSLSSCLCDYLSVRHLASHMDGLRGARKEAPYFSGFVVWVRKVVALVEIEDTYVVEGNG